MDKFIGRSGEWIAHIILFLGACFLVVPVWMIFMSSTHFPVTLVSEGMQAWWGNNFLATYGSVLFDKTGYTEQITAMKMLMNSAVLGFGFAIGKVIVSSMAAYALVYYRFKLAVPLFWVILLTLLLPLEVRIIPSYQVMADLNLLNTYTGLILPLIASATGTFFFRQFYMTVPDELLEAARLDGANSIKFFIDILVPLSKSMIAAIFIFMFVVGWNQYLWPVLMTTDESHMTVLLGIKQIYESDFESGYIPEFNRAFALTILALLPPVSVVVILQRWFIRGLIQTEK